MRKSPSRHGRRSSACNEEKDVAEFARIQTNPHRDIQLALCRSASEFLRIQLRQRTIGPKKFQKDFCRNRASLCANVLPEMSVGVILPALDVKPSLPVSRAL